MGNANEKKRSANLLQLLTAWKHFTHFTNMEDPRCSVDGCGKKHHHLLHSEDKTKSNYEGTQALSGFVSTRKQNLLPTACTRVIYEGKECSVRILLDSGSQETFLRTTIASDLNMKRHGPPTTMNIKVLGGQEQRKRMSHVKFKLAPLDSTDDQVIQFDSVCSPLADVDVDVTRYTHLRNIKLADTFSKEPGCVDLLVGADQYYKLVQSTIKKGRPGTPVATKSRLGWLLSGPFPGSSLREETTAMLSVTRIESPHDELNRFHWNPGSADKSDLGRRGGCTLTVQQYVQV